MPGLLSLSTFLPLAGAGAIVLLARDRTGAARWIALASSLGALFGWLLLFARFDPKQGVQFQAHAPWFPGFGVSYSVGLDGVSLCMFGLSGLFVLLAILASTRVATRTRSYFALLCVLQVASSLAFAAQDLIVFLVGSELAALSFYLLVAGWGGERGAYAATKAFLFTFSGAACTGVAMLVLTYLNGSSADIASMLLNHPAGVAPMPLQAMLFLALAAGFIVQLPLVPVHTWLPDLFEAAPLPIAGLYACILSPLAGYGLLRLAFGIMPGPAQALSPFLMSLAVLTMLYAAWGALSQVCWPSFVAFASIGLSGASVLAMTGFTRAAIEGSARGLVQHAAAVALLASIGVAIARRHPSDSPTQGPVKTPPRLRAFVLLGALAALLSTPWTALAWIVPNHLAVFALTLLCFLICLLILFRFTRRLTASAFVQAVPDLGRSELVRLAGLGLLLVFLIGCPPLVGNVMAGFSEHLAPLLGL